jgi:prolyl-tRNA synthetase
VFIALQFIVCKIQLVKFHVVTATPADEHGVPEVLNIASNKFFVQGVPIRIELGPKDMKQKKVVAVRRDTGEKLTLQRETAGSDILQLLETIHHNMLDK